MQNIDVVRQVWSLDIKPTSCPNPIQVGSNGGNAAVMMALLGTASQDVLMIDPASVAIWREDCVSGPVYPIEFGYFPCKNDIVSGAALSVQARTTPNPNQP